MFDSKHTLSLLDQIPAIFSRRLPSNPRITCSKIDVGRAISKITRCGVQADAKGAELPPSMPLEG